MKKKSTARRANNKLAEERKHFFEAYHLVYYGLGAIESLLGFRLVFKLLGANPTSAFVSMVYSLGGILISPFRSIFHPAVTSGVETVSVFEPATLIAMVVFALIGWGLAKLIAIWVADELS
ncbi:MAG TPA: hypothetical protein VLG36_04730 [Candidatus Chromulinivoraceae bacterium]|nr:hypothetical protein [Candidatus Chromulinivoraceae bacterium]